MHDDLWFMREAVQLAEEAERRGNLPIGAVIAARGQIIARGMNAIWKPDTNLTRHAEMAALADLPPGYRADCQSLTLYTTLEPCVMCAGAILLHQVGRVVFGASDPNGGATTSLATLPPWFSRVFAQTRWVGPILPAECDPLYRRAVELER